MAVRNGPNGVYNETYSVNNVAEGATMYVGKTTASGVWLIQRYTEATGVMEYANVSNNNGVAGYGVAWIGKATLTYGPFESLTGV